LRLVGTLDRDVAAPGRMLGSTVLRAGESRMLSMTLLKHTMTLEVHRVGLDPANPEEFSCGRCGQVLEIHQPAADEPDLLLGTCPDCASWFIIGVSEDEAAICLLAGVDLVRTTMAAAAAGFAGTGEAARDPA
jgi:hypothetical protein